ncbi:TFIIH subunit TTDA/Tfb5 [Phakopsora pachyrhizi]|nr:TFIIH subunit TTDA/Tfb5 [Phakopsora pachyrhizi]
MVRAVKGVLLTCDPAVKQLILSLNDNPNNYNSNDCYLSTPFIIQDLDETHVLVTNDCVNQVRAKVEAELEKNTFTLEAV